MSDFGRRPIIRKKHGRKKLSKVGYVDIHLAVWLAKDMDSPSGVVLQLVESYACPTATSIGARNKRISVPLNKADRLALIAALQEV